MVRCLTGAHRDGAPSHVPWGRRGTTGATDYPIRTKLDPLGPDRPLKARGTARMRKRRRKRDRNGMEAGKIKQGKMKTGRMNGERRRTP